MIQQEECARMSIKEILEVLKHENFKSNNTSLIQNDNVDIQKENYPIDVNLNLSPH
jgi:GH25 family lysozyme M1 (1,4-beta-N-acetylmuramidase)